MSGENRLGSSTITLKSRPKIISCASVAGKKEEEGPLGELFDKTFDDPRLGQKSFEKGESELQKLAVELALQKSELAACDIEMFFGGDLLNQCMATTLGVEKMSIPYLGVYGACSTMAESLLLAAICVDGGYARKALAVTSSHFCSAERQFRFPLEYGGQRTQNAQWTVTGAGAAVVAAEGTPMAEVTLVCPGRIVDLDITDVNNMGAAMAPAAADTLTRYFKDTGSKPEDYSLIVTGDLGVVGSEILCELMKRENYDIAKLHRDCGLMIFDRETQDVHAGGSGCGCAASVLCAKILPQLATKQLSKVLFMATGALMSPTTSQQGDPIVGIAHLLLLEAAGG